MNKIKRNFILFAAIVSVLLLTWGNINAQTTMPVTIAFDVVGYLNGNSLNTDASAYLYAAMHIYPEDYSWILSQELSSEISNQTGNITRDFDWHPTVTYDLVLGQKYYFEWVVSGWSFLKGTGAAAGQFEWNLSGVGNSSGAQWLEQNYYAFSWVQMYGPDNVSIWKESNDPLNATASVSFYTTWLNGTARLGSSLLDIAGYAEMPVNTQFDYGFFRTFASAQVLVQPVPEPASLVLLGAGVLGLGVVGWYRRRRKE